MSGVIQMRAGAGGGAAPVTAYWFGRFALSATALSAGFSSVRGDPLGNIYVVTVGVNGANTIIAKFDPVGTLLWQKSVTPTASRFVGAVSACAVSSSGIVVAIHDYASGGTANLLHVVSLAADGSTVFNKDLSFPAIANGIPYRPVVSVDGSGNVYVCATVNVAAAPWFPTANFAKLNSAGVVQFHKTLANCFVSGCVTDSAGSVSLLLMPSEDGGNSLFKWCIRRFDSSGNQTANYPFDFGIVAPDWMNVTPTASLSINASGTYAVQLVVYDSAVYDGMFIIASVNSSGTLLWVKHQWDSGQAYSSKGVAIDSSGNVYAAHNDYQVLSFDKYNSSGTFQLARKRQLTGYGDRQVPDSDGISVSPTGTLLACNSNPIVSNEQFVIVQQVPLDGTKTGTYTVAGASMSYTSDIDFYLTGTLVSATTFTTAFSTGSATSSDSAITIATASGNTMSVTAI